MPHTDSLAARLRELQRRAAATDRATTATLTELRTAGAAVAAAMARLADAMEAQQ